MQPYQNLSELENNKSYKIFSRIIYFNQQDEELKWHRDNNNRSILIKSGSNWQLQFENTLPITLIINNTYFIKKDQWHRVIKGNNDLLIEITEFF
jgi:hypothetical protein